MPGKNYKINESKSYCTIDNINKDNKAKTYTNKYGEHIIESLSKTEKCYIYFDKNTEIVNTVLGNIEVNNYIPDFSKIATTDEGIFKAEDNDGISYYWRGAATTNYLKFGGFCWRIVRLNGDKTIRLIYDGITCHNNGEASNDSIAGSKIAYNTKYDHSEYVGWTYVEGKQRPEVGDTAIDSNAKTKTEEWYNMNLVSYSSKIADGKFCNDRETGLKPTLEWDGYTTSWSTTGAPFSYSAAKRVYDTRMPNLSCDIADLLSLKVGAITADEVMLSGGGSKNNTSYFMYTGQNYWVMTSNRWYNNNAYIFRVDSDGILGWNSGFRPVINLKSEVTFSSGDGTINNPYVVQ